MLVYNNLYSIHTVRGQVADSYKNVLNMYMSQIDAGLNDVDAYMNNVAGTGYDLLSLEQAETDSDYYSAQIYLFNKLSKDITLYRSLSSFFVFVGSRNDFMDVSRSQEYSLEEKDRIQKELIERIHSNDIVKGTTAKRWFYIQVDETYFLVDLVQAGNTFIGAWLRTDDLLKPLQSMQIGEGGSLLLANDQGAPITANRISDTGIELHMTEDNYYLSGSKKKYLIVGAPSTKGEFNLAAVIPDRQILAKLPYLQGLIWIITILSFLLVPVGIYLIRKTFMVPLYRLVLSMKKVRLGDWSSRVSMDDQSEEFQILGDSFNAMMSEIHSLRVNVYEEQLNKQREELQRLQLQVNPHFFLNTLNIVFNLAKVKNFELIMDMTRSLTQYFRYMFRSNTSFVKLKEELEHIRNYMRIQGLRFPGQLTWTIQAPEHLSDTPIPPLAIQSFVENSIKHAITMDEPLHIAVCIDDGEESIDSHLHIGIRDTGPGFPAEVLQELQAGRSVENENGEHTGIWNVQRRLELLYRTPISIRYANISQKGGASVDLILPTNPIKEGST